MAAASLPDILDRCIDDIRDGRATLDECLARYPEIRDDLEPLLRVVASIAPLASLPDPARTLAARVRFIEALHAEPDKPGLAERVRRLFRPSPSFRLGRPGLASVAIVAALVSTTGVLYASEQALPGAPLYGIKLAVEQVRLSAALNDEITAQVKMEIAERRLTEIERAAATNDTTAMQLAAEYYGRAVDDASATLDRIPPSDLAVLDRIQDNLRHQQDVLSRVAHSAPDVAKGSLDRAQQQTRAGLERAAAVGGSRGSSAPPERATSTPTARPTSPPPTATTRITGQIAATSAVTAVAVLPTTLPTAIPPSDASEVATPAPIPSATTARSVTPDPTATARRPTPRPAREDDEDGTARATPVPAITAPAGTVPPAVTRGPVDTGRGNSEDEADHPDSDDDDGNGRENRRVPTVVPATAPALATILPGDTSEFATPAPMPSATTARPATPDPTATARRPTPRPAREDDEDGTARATPVPAITAPAGTVPPAVTRRPVDTGRGNSEDEADHPDGDEDDGNGRENRHVPTVVPATVPALATVVAPPTPPLSTAIPPTVPAVATARPPLVPTVRIDNSRPGPGPAAPVDPQPPVPPAAPEPPGRSDESSTSGRRSGEGARPESPHSSGRNSDTRDRPNLRPPEPTAGGMGR